MRHNIKTKNAPKPKVMQKGSSGDAGGNKQLSQPVKQELTPPPCSPTLATDPLLALGSG